MTQLHSKNVIIRKPHRCFSCLRVFPEKTRMNYQTNVCDNEIYSLYTCETCSEIMSLCDDNEYEYGFVMEMLSKNETPEHRLEKLVHSKRIDDLQTGDTVSLNLGQAKGMNLTYEGIVCYKHDGKGFRGGAYVSINVKNEVYSFTMGDWEDAKCYIKRKVLLEKAMPYFAQTRPITIGVVLDF